MQHRMYLRHENGIQLGPFGVSFAACEKKIGVPYLSIHRVGQECTSIVHDMLVNKVLVETFMGVHVHWPLSPTITAPELVGSMDYTSTGGGFRDSDLA